MTIREEIFATYSNQNIQRTPSNKVKDKQLNKKIDKSDKSWKRQPK